MSLYSSYTMEELVSTIPTIHDRDDFIAATKAFVQKFADANYVPSTQVDDAKETSYEEGFDVGYKEGQKELLTEGLD